MDKVVVDQKIDIPNMLLISGNGRNVGKTTLACQIITHLSKQDSVSAIKISSHFHPYDENNLILFGTGYVVLKEQNQSTKDSSRMLQAGAQTVFFIMAQQQQLTEVFERLADYLPKHPIVCESGGLSDVADTGAFLFVNLKDREIEKDHLLKLNPTRVENDGKNFNLDLNRIVFANQRILINNE